jgi:hypothetical protein
VGRTEPITVYEPWRAERYESEQAVLMKFEEGLKAFYQGDIEQARDCWEPIAEADPPAKAYLARCRELPTDLPADWDGTWHLTEK